MNEILKAIAADPNVSAEFRATLFDGHLLAQELSDLHSINAELLAALQKVSQTITIEHSLHPDYGWKEWLEAEILPVIRKATT